MADTRPRNWKAMRADRVMAMAENKFGERFSSKEAAIARLEALSPRDQRALRKTHVSTAERARRASASDRMIAGMSASPAREPKMANSIADRLKGLKPAQLAAVAKEMGIAVPSRATAARLTTAILQERSRLDHAASKGHVASKTGGAWGASRPVVDAERRGAVSAARSATDARINAAIDKLAPAAKGARAPSPSIAAANERLTAALGKPSFHSELAAVTKGMKADEIQSLAKDFALKPTRSKQTALKAIEGRHNSLLTSFAKTRSTAGRLAGAIALAVGVGTVIADTMSSNAMAANNKKKAQGTSKNTVEAKKAEAQAKQAEAEAAKAATEAKRLEIEAADRAADRTAKRREADKAPLEQVRQIGLVAAPLAAGMAYGAHKANKIASEVEKGAAAKNKELVSVAKKVRGSKSPARMAAAVKVADELKLTKVKGPVGGVTAGFLVTEAVAARVVAAHTENETASEVLNSAAIGLGAAAVSTVGTRLVQRATSSVLPNASAMVEVETARENLKAAAPKAAAKRKMLAKAGRFALPALVGLAAAAAYSEARAGGADTAGASVEGAKAAGDVISGGAISAHDEAKARGAGEAEAVATGATVGAINLATFGVAEMANDALAAHGGVAGAITDTVSAAGKKVGELLGWSDEARAASAEVRKAGSRVAKELFGGTAHAADAPVAAGGDDASLAAQLGGTIIGGVGGAAVMVGRDMLKSPTHNIGGRLIDVNGNPITRAGKVARVAKGVGTMGAGLALASLGFAISVAGKGKAAEGKAYLNDGAARKAAEIPKLTPAAPVSAAAPQRSADGQTEGYTRRGRNGLTIQVKAYRTPTR